MKKFLWLDDYRKSPSGYIWVKNYDEAVAALKVGDIEFASLDHDLSEEHYNTSLDESQYVEKTGYNLICWMEENDVWPPMGVRVHTLNPVGRGRMLMVINKVYGETFQTHTPPSPWT